MFILTKASLRSKYPSQMRSPGRLFALSLYVIILDRKEISFCKSSGRELGCTRFAPRNIFEISRDKRGLCERSIPLYDDSNDAIQFDNYELHFSIQEMRFKEIIYKLILIIDINTIIFSTICNDILKLF